MHLAELIYTTALFVVSAASAGTLAPIAECPVLPDAAKQRLAEYVAKKYEIPEGVKVSIKDTSVVPGSCYRKLVFAGQGPLGVFNLSLFLAPDLRFLTPDLLDSSTDPQQERKAKAETLMRELAAGEYASLGSATAPVTVVVFSDFQCPFCKQAAKILAEEPLIKNGNDVRLIFRHLPLPQHGWAQRAAQAAACAQFQNATAFWALHDVLFRSQQKITNENVSTEISTLAAAVPALDQKAFRECVDRQMSLGAVLRDKELAARVGVQATPTVFINGEISPILAESGKFQHSLKEAVRRAGKVGEVDKTHRPGIAAR